MARTLCPHRVSVEAAHELTATVNRVSLGESNSDYCETRRCYIQPEEAFGICNDNSPRSV